MRKKQTLFQREKEGRRLRKRKITLGRELSAQKTTRDMASQTGTDPGPGPWGGELEGCRRLIQRVRRPWSERMSNSRDKPMALTSLKPNGTFW